MWGGEDKEKFGKLRDIMEHWGEPTHSNQDLLMSKPLVIIILFIHFLIRYEGQPTSELEREVTPSTISSDEMSPSLAPPPPPPPSSLNTSSPSMMITDLPSPEYVSACTTAQHNFMF